jgi:hypothetical protein
MLIYATRLHYKLGGGGEDSKRKEKYHLSISNVSCMFSIPIGTISPECFIYSRVHWCERSITDLNDYKCVTQVVSCDLLFFFFFVELLRINFFSTIYRLLSFHIHCLGGGKDIG